MSILCDFSLSVLTHDFTQSLRKVANTHQIIHFPHTRVWLARSCSSRTVSPTLHPNTCHSFLFSFLRSISNIVTISRESQLGRATFQGQYAKPSTSDEDKLMHIVADACDEETVLDQGAALDYEDDLQHKTFTLPPSSSSLASLEIKSTAIF